MVRGRFSALRRAVALAPLLLVVVYVPGQMMLRCRMDGVVRATCCCPAGDVASGPRSPSAEYGLKGQDCCEHRLSTSARQPVEPAATAAASLPRPSLSGILAFSVVSVSPGADPVRANRAWRANGPPDHGAVARVLLKHSFLI